MPILDTPYGALPATLASKFGQIRLLACDVDGVFSDGRIFMGNNGEELKVFHARDGYGVKALLAAGIDLGIITGRQSRIVSDRMESLGVETIVQGCTRKLPEFRKMIDHYGLNPSEVAFFGDDMPDLACMEFAGMAIAVNDAHHSVLQIAHYTTTLNGGYGAVREVADLILLCQDKQAADDLASG